MESREPPQSPIPATEARDSHSAPYRRPETGPMRFGDDWTGIFIRGDNAFGYALALSIVCDAAERAGAHPLHVAQARGLLDLLGSSNEMKPVTPQQIRPFADAVELKD